jgi:hypothetical protein
MELVCNLLQRRSSDRYLPSSFDRRVLGLNWNILVVSKRNTVENTRLDDSGVKFCTE